MKDISKKTYKELEKEQKNLEFEYSAIEDDCAKKGLSYNEFCEKAHDVKEKLYFLSKYKRLKSEPTVTYGKEWKGETMPFEKFKKECENSYLTDDDGIGYYATKEAKSNIEIIPSDILENIYRNDFTHVIWMNR